MDLLYRFGALGWTASAKQAPAISRIQKLMRVGPILQPHDKAVRGCGVRFKDFRF